MRHLALLALPLLVTSAHGDPGPNPRPNPTPNPNPVEPRLGPAFEPIVGVRTLAGRLIARPHPTPHPTPHSTPSINQDAATQALLAPTLLRRHAATNEYILTVPPGETEASFADRLLSTGLFEFVEPDWLVTPAIIPNDPRYATQWHLPRMALPAAWDLTTGAPSVVVAFCDSGVDPAHPDLAPRLIPGYNAVDHLPQADGGLIAALNDHGTGVAGCIGAIGNNAVGIAGAAWNISLMPVRVSNAASGNAFLSDINEGARWAADHGAAIVNISYNGVGSAANRATAAYLAERGVSCVWAAGNSSTNAYGADIPNLFIVGATAQNDTLASFSNFGPAIDVVAPGVGIWTTKVGGYMAIDGTSFAAPLTAGVLALTRSVNPAWSSLHAEYAVASTASDLGAAGRDDIFGRGIVNAAAAVRLADRALREPFAPIAQPDRYTALAGAETDLDVLANDLDLNTDPIALAHADPAAPPGPVSIATHPGARDTIRIIADATARGAYSIPYTITDPSGLSATTEAVVVVVPPLRFDAPTFGDPNLYSDLSALEAANLDNDGDPDIIAGSIIGPYFFRNDNGALTFVRNTLVQAGADRLAVADLNGDHIPDYVSTSVYGSSFAVGLSTSPWNYTVTPTSTQALTDLILTDESGRSLDFNRDGRTDLVTLSSTTPVLEIRLGDGAGGFAAPRTYTVGFGPLVVRAADLNRDGFTDLIVGCSGNFSIDVFLGRAAGDFAPRRTTNVGVVPRDIRVLDADQDGVPDIAVLSDGFLAQVTGILLFRPAPLAGAYTLWQTLAAGGDMPSALAVADFNRDGSTDLIAINATPRTRSFYANLGDEGPTIDPLNDQTTLSKLTSALAADLNGDGVPDLLLGGRRVAAPIEEGAIEVLINRTPRLCPADFNNDGFLDFFDYDTFVDCFVGRGCPTPPHARTADFNHDAFNDFFDYGDFLTAFEAGC